MNDQEVLIDFLRTPLGNSDAILKRFAALPGAVHRGTGDEQFVFIKGTRANRIVLVAHADTSRDIWGTQAEAIPDVRVRDGIVSNSWGGLGADDRAGCAMVWLLKDTGHSILITSGEERGGVGADWLMECNPDIKKEINAHCAFALELDRRYGDNYKCYDVGTSRFKRYLERITQYTESKMGGFTDICVLCEQICGVNLSVGYYNEHTDNEYLVYSEWANTLELCRRWLKERMPIFKRREYYEDRLPFRGYANAA